MAMMDIRPMGVCVHHWLVSVQVSVLGHRMDSIFAHVVVMAIDVCVEVHMRQQCMRMPVLVSFTRENPYTDS